MRIARKFFVILMLAAALFSMACERRGQQETQGQTGTTPGQQETQRPPTPAQESPAATPATPVTPGQEGGSTTAPGQTAPGTTPGAPAGGGNQ